MTSDLLEDGPIVLFDGICNLCSGYVQFIVPRDEAGKLRFASLQSEVAADLLADREPDPDDLDSIVLVEGERTYTKSTAVLRIATHLGGVYRLAWPLRFVPRVLRDLVYDLVAANRYRIFGKKDRCEIPEGDVGARFVELAAEESTGGESVAEESPDPSAADD